MRNKKEQIGDLLLLAIVPVLCFYLMESYTHNPFEEVRQRAQLLNIIFFEIVGLLFFFLIGKVKTALRTELVLSMIYGLANAYVVRFRTNPIVPWDIFSWKTAASVASNYDFKPDVRMVIVTLVFIVLIVLVGGRKIGKTDLKKIKIWKRLSSLAIVGLALFVFAGCVQDENFQTKNKLYPFLFTPVYMTDVNGIAVTFVMNLAYVSVDKPDNYDADEMAELLAQYSAVDCDNQNIPSNNSGEQEASSKELPNIIVIMDEAFSDLAVLGEFETNEDYMPFIHGLMNGEENTISGTLNVSVCGGNTANSEFEFLTGHTMAFLPQGSIPYQQYITEEVPALPSYLRELGYETIGMHPYGASGWDRDTIYPLLGFSECYFLSDYINASYLRKYVDDETCFEKIIEQYETKDDAPLFVFNVTMQNHGAYADSYANFIPDINIDGIDNFSVSQYFSLIKETDRAFKNFVEYFSNVDEKTIIVFFGDHQPNDSIASPILSLQGKAASTLSEEELKCRYEVPYVIWANYDIEEESHVETSLNYLSAHVLEIAGIECSPYQKYLLELESNYPVISAMRVKKADGTDTNAAALKEELSEYQALQYYQLFDLNEE